MFGTFLGAALESAVLAVPAGHAQTGAVLALTVFVASDYSKIFIEQTSQISNFQFHVPRIAKTFIAEFSGPSGVADARAGLASTVSATVDTAGGFGTVLSGPALGADAFVQFETEGALIGAIG